MRTAMGNGALFARGLLARGLFAGGLLAAGLLGGALPPAAAQEAHPAPLDATALDPETRAAAEAALARGLAWLASQQAADGAWRSQTYGLLRGGDSVSAIAVLALARARAAGLGSEPATTAEGRGHRWLAGRIDGRGALATGGDIEEYPVYATACWLASGGAEPTDAERLAAYLALGQHAEATGWAPADPAYGGWGFRGHGMDKPRSQRVDISQTAMALEALAGAKGRAVPPPPPIRARALVFIDRCQNLAPAPAVEPTCGEPAGPRATGAASGQDGGFFFTTVDESFQKTPRLPGAGAEGAPPRYASYGSATADGVLALLAAGVPPSDRRVQAAATWLVAHFRPDRNPGFVDGIRPPMDEAMTFYWSWRAARSLAALERAQPGGLAAHLAWRAPLARALTARQRDDGSWRNEVTLMKEDDPLIATSEAVLALVEMLAR